MVNNSDQTFFIQLTLWTTCNGVSMLAVWLLLLAILRSPTCRRSPFNLYLVLSLLPDAYKNLSGFLANLTNLIADEGNPTSCVVIGWNDVYWWTANLWTACAVFYQLHQMLKASKMARRHAPPSRQRVLKEGCAVQAAGIFMACLTLLPLDFIPKATPESGCEAFPAPGNTGQLVFYWAFFMPISALLPTLLVTLLCIDIWVSKLLPVNGKSRSLLIYFARLLAVIYITAIAVVVSFFFHNWVQAIAFAVFNLVGLFQVVLALMKRDIRKAWVEMFTCKRTDEAGHGELPSTDTTHDVASPVPEFSHFQSSRLHRLNSSLLNLFASITQPGKVGHSVTSPNAHPDIKDGTEVDTSDLALKTEDPVTSSSPSKGESLEMNPLSKSIVVPEGEDTLGGREDGKGAGVSFASSSA